MKFENLCVDFIDQIAGETTASLIADQSIQDSEKQVLHAIIQQSTAAERMATNAISHVGSTPSLMIFKALVAAGIQHGWYLRAAADRLTKDGEGGLTPALDMELEQILQQIRKDRM